MAVYRGAVTVRVGRRSLSGHVEPVMLKHVGDRVIAGQFAAGDSASEFDGRRARLETLLAHRTNR